MKMCLESETNGFIINPWGQSFMLAKELIEMIFQADSGVEYSVPDDPITRELLEDGSFLKRAIEICSRNRTQLNMIKLCRILRDSWVWIPCNAVMSDADYEAFEKIVMAAKDGEGLDSLVGQTFTAHDETRLIPDILQNGDEFFFPVFTTAEEMGEYGNNFSKVEKHFLEAAWLKTALGQNIYTQAIQPNGHYNHLDTINRVRACGSIRAFLEKEGLTDGIMAHLEKRRVPYVLAGSIRDDGPLPEVTGNVYDAQNKMRDQVRGATTVICLASMLHSIAVGNMTPSYRVMPDGTIREVYFYCVDISEFTANKLGDRGSLSAKGIVTNVQDFIVTLCTGLEI